MHISFVFNVKHKEPSLSIKEQDEQEFDSPQAIKKIYQDLKILGYEVTKVEADENVFFKIKKLKNKTDLVFSTAEGLKGDARESQVSMFCEMLGIPYTHSTPTTHAIVLDKTFTKMIIKAVGIKVPDSFLVSKKDRTLPNDIKFPVIIKPNTEGSSIGILNINVISDITKLDERINSIYKTNFSGDLMVEEFIEGREFTVSVIGNGHPKVLPIIEQKFDFLPPGYHKIAGYELKWLYEDHLKDLKQAYDCPAKISKKLEKEIKDTSIRIYKALRIRDCARIDYRLDNKNKLYVLEVNSLPGLNFNKKEISYFPISARVGGFGSMEILDHIIKTALERYR